MEQNTSGFSDNLPSGRPTHEDNGKRSLGVLLSSRSDEWETPDWLFGGLSWVYGEFTLDPCATALNAKCEHFFTRKEDGLVQPWEAGKVFMNPPYGRNIGHWMQKAFEESLKGALVVCLIPARTDTKWWHEYAMRGHIYHWPGRITFKGAKHPAPFPSAIVTFGRYHTIWTR